MHILAGQVHQPREKSKNIVSNYSHSQGGNGEKTGHVKPDFSSKTV